MDENLTTEQRVTALMEQMTVSEKIWQMILVERGSIFDPLDIAKYSIWAVLNGSGDNPFLNTSSGWLEMVNNMQAYAQRSRLRIPLLYGVDTTHWHTNVHGATVFPHSIWLWATRDADLVRRIGKATAEEMVATNIFWWYSPNLDIAIDPRWGRFYESFGSDPNLVWELGQAYIGWFQSNLSNGARAMATAKHYLGNGSMVWGSSSQSNYFIDKWWSFISEKELREVHLVPFKKAVDAKVWSVMIGLNSWKWVKVSANKYLITDLLKKELWFDGIVISDWYWAYEIEWNGYKSLIKAINAGIDMVMLPYDYKSFSANMETAVKKWDVSMERIDDAVRRILTKKIELWLFKKNLIPKKDFQIFWSTEHRNIAREAVRKSLVLLKNNDNLLPLSKETKKIIISGSAANNLGKQSWGWTIEWQGVDWNKFPGTTILSGIRNIVSKNTDIEFSELWDFWSSEIADVGIAIVWEDPYAEWVWDKRMLVLSNQDLAAIQKTKSSCRRLVVIIISGRPINIRNQEKDWWAIIAAWLPWSEWQGVADVIFWDYPFTGQLPVKWDLK